MRWLFLCTVLVGCKREPSKVDADQDGVTADVDCNDDDPTVFPGVTEQVYDGVDNDCDPATIDDDLDEDGFLLADDCDDRNADIHPDRAETPYDGVDNDCDPTSLDDDLDGDGFGIASDCADGNPDINPDADEIYYDSIDNDCDPLLTIDDDQDRDQVPFALDCDDLDPLARAAGLYFEDCDSDGFAAGIDGAVEACELPPAPECGGTWTLLEPVDGAHDASNATTDCADADSSAFPGQTESSSTPVNEADVDFEFDLDCDGGEVPLYDEYSCNTFPDPGDPGAFLCTHIPGFTVPTACGDDGEYASGCVVDTDQCDLSQTETRTQECR